VSGAPAGLAARSRSSCQAIASWCHAGGAALLAVVAAGLLAERVLRASLLPAELAPLLAPLRTAWFAAAAIAVAAALLIALWLTGSVLRPIREMRRMASALAAGDLGYRLPLRFGDELGEIAGALQRMSGQLRERAELATREKEQLQAVLDGMVEGVLVVDPDQRILLGNQHLRDFFGVAAELRGRTAWRRSDIPSSRRCSRRPNTDGPVSRSDRRGCTRSPHPCACTARLPARRRRQRWDGRRAARRDRADAAREDAPGVRRQRVTSCAPRSPRSAASPRHRGPALSDADRRAYLEVIDRHARRLSAIVSDLLELSKIEGRRDAPELASVDVARLAET
jgi:two-component system phosphate regulon sensor histidine kinase PhoR